MSEDHRYALVDIIHNIIVLGTTRTIISCEHSLTTRTIISCEQVWRLRQLLIVNTVCGIVVPTA